MTIRSLHGVCRVLLLERGAYLPAKLSYSQLTKYKAAYCNLVCLIAVMRIDFIELLIVDI